MNDLTPRQKEVLDLIIEHVEETGRFPAIRDIAAALRLNSTATVHQHLSVLEAKSCLYRQGRRWMLRPELRGDRGVPIVGRVAAGAPLMAVESIEGHLSPEFMGHRRGRFSVQVVGESMIGEGILDGDYVVLDPDASINQGDLVVAYLGEEQEATVKRFHRGSGSAVDHIELRPANPAFEPILVPVGDPYFRIAGKVVGLMRRF